MSAKQRLYPCYGLLNGCNKLLEMCFEFPFNLIHKSTMPFLTRKSWCVLKSWFTSGTGISVVFSSSQSCCHNFKTFGLKIIPLFVFITCDSTAVGTEHSVKQFVEVGGLITLNLLRKSFLFCTIIVSNINSISSPLFIVFVCERSFSIL